MRRCHKCQEIGHLAYNCPRKEEATKEEGGREKTESKMETKSEQMGKWPIKCYTCGMQGHGSWACPQHALFCGAGADQKSTCSDQVEGMSVEDILLDTGCSRTMVRRELVDEEKALEGEAIVPMEMLPCIRWQRWIWNWRASR